MLRYHLSGQWMASPDPVRFTIKRFNENMTQNYNNGVVIITEPGFYTVTAYFQSRGDTYTQIMKNYNGVQRTGVLGNIHIYLRIQKFLYPKIDEPELKEIIVEP